MAKRRRRKHEGRKMPDDPRLLAANQRTAQSRGGQAAYHHDNESGESSEMRGYAALWRAVLGQAVMDAKSKRSKKEYHYIRHTAIHWLMENEVDFNMVCDLAGLDPESTRRRLLAANEGRFNRTIRPTASRNEQKENRGALRADLFELGLLPKLSPPRRIKHRRNFATRGLEIRQMEFCF